MAKRTRPSQDAAVHVEPWSIRDDAIQKASSNTNSLRTRGNSQTTPPLPSTFDIVQTRRTLLDCTDVNYELARVRVVRIGFRLRRINKGRSTKRLVSRGRSSLRGAGRGISGESVCRRSLFVVGFIKETVIVRLFSPRTFVTVVSAIEHVENQTLMSGNIYSVVTCRFCYRGKRLTNTRKIKLL